LEAWKNLGVSHKVVAKSLTSVNMAQWHQVFKKEGTIKVDVIGGSVPAGH
jgi:hypothetical protein